jgi:methylenetetrahydrofolate reductase (NADPH)
VLLQKVADAAAEDVHKIGEEHTIKQIAELKANGVAGIHLYTLNRSPAIKNIVDRI